MEERAALLGSEWEEPGRAQISRGPLTQRTLGARRGGLAVARRALDAMAAPLTSPPDSHRHEPAMNAKDDDDDEETVRNALLLKTVTERQDPTIVTTTPSTRTYHWPDWRRAPVVQSADSAPADPDGSGRRKTPGMSRQKNYVSVTVAGDGATSGYGKWCSLASWRPREKWLLLLLVLVSAACLAVVAASLVALLRPHSAQSKRPTLSFRT